MSIRKPKILVCFYSSHGSLFHVAQEISKGAQQNGAEVTLRRFDEVYPLQQQQISQKEKPSDFQKQLQEIEIISPNELKYYDGFIFGTPTAFGLMSAQMKTFFDSLGDFWATQPLKGKVASLFTCSSAQHGGNEIALFTSLVPFIQLGCLYAGVPYSEKGGISSSPDTGASAFGTTVITGNQSDKQPSKREMDQAFLQGKYIAEISAQLIKP